jgi:hypothetical protein
MLHSGHPYCPHCFEPVQVHAHGYLLQQLIPAALQDCARSNAFALYTRLRACQFFRSDTALGQIGEMARLWWTGNRAAAEHLVDTWDTYRAALADLEQGCYTP